MLTIQFSPYVSNNKDSRYVGLWMLNLKVHFWIMRDLNWLKTADFGKAKECK